MRASVRVSTHGTVEHAGGHAGAHASENAVELEGEHAGERAGPGDNASENAGERAGERAGDVRMLHALAMRRSEGSSRAWATARRCMRMRR